MLKKMGLGRCNPLIYWLWRRYLMLSFGVYGATRALKSAHGLR